MAVARRGCGGEDGADKRAPLVSGRSARRGLSVESGGARWASACVAGRAVEGGEGRRGLGAGRRVMRGERVGRARGAKGVNWAEREGGMWTAGERGGDLGRAGPSWVLGLGWFSIYLGFSLFYF